MRISDGADNFALFEKIAPRLYLGHYQFSARGKEAVQAGKAILTKAFATKDVEVIVGLTPIEELGARWLSRQLGFKSQGIEDTVEGPAELFIMTRNEFNG